MNYRTFNFNDDSSVLICVQPTPGNRFTVQSTAYVSGQAYTATMRDDMPLEEAVDHIQATTPEDALCFRLEAGYCLGIAHFVSLRA